MRLYNPRNGHEFVTESDDELHVAIYLDAGWEPAPEPEPAVPGFEPEPVRYEPVTAAKKARGAKKTASEDDTSD